MDEMSLAVIAVICAILYWAGALLLLFKNWHRLDVLFVVAGVIVLWPMLLFMSIMQLVVVIPLYTIFFLNGPMLSKSLPLKTVCIAIGLTLAFLAAVSVYAFLS